MSSTYSKIEGVGIGLRFEHFDQIMESKPSVPWFEILVDNILDDSPEFYMKLDEFRCHYPIVFHGVGLNLGAAQPPDKTYLSKINEMILRYQPLFYSEHLAWTGIGGAHHYDLLPLPYHEESLHTLATNIEITQETLGRKLTIENPSAYLGFKNSTFDEPDFISELIKRTGVGVLLDINNVFVSCENFSLSCKEYLDKIEADAVDYIHMAGHEKRAGYLFDSHGKPVDQSVLDLLDYFSRSHGVKPAMIEWDSDIPGFEDLLNQASLIAEHNQGAHPYV